MPVRKVLFLIEPKAIGAREPLVLWAHDITILLFIYPVHRLAHVLHDEESWHAGTS
jgi:hypothetical protein